MPCPAPPSGTQGSGKTQTPVAVDGASSKPLDGACPPKDKNASTSPPRGDPRPPPRSLPRLLPDVAASATPLTPPTVTSRPVLAAATVSGLQPRARTEADLNPVTIETHQMANERKRDFFVVFSLNLRLRRSLWGSPQFFDLGGGTAYRWVHMS